VARLSSSGSAKLLRRQLFPLGFSGEVMLHVVDTWLKFSPRHSVRHETKITAIFRDALIKAYVAAGRSWFIALEDPITDPNFGTELGRNDLRFYPQNHYGQTVFFTVECKRLRVQRKTGVIHLADKYVEDGMQRFVDGQYSSELPCGGMVGYVMDNNISDAFEAVQTAIKTNRRKLKIPSKGIVNPSAALPKYKWSVDTQHSRTGGAIKLHHALLGVAK
jgi:hypothetical protein